MFKSTLQKRKETGFIENPNLIKVITESTKPIHPTSDYELISMRNLKKKEKTSYNEWKTLKRYFNEKYSDFYQQIAKEQKLAKKHTTLESRVPLSIIFFNISKNGKKQFKPKFKIKKNKTEKLLKSIKHSNKVLNEKIK